MQTLNSLLTTGKCLAIALVSLFFLVSKCQAGYIIQDDCYSAGDNDQRTFLSEAFNSAHNLARNAESQLQNLAGPQQELFTWLFGPVDRVGRVQGNFRNLQQLSLPKDGFPDGQDVRVYCTDERLKCKKDPKNDSHFPYKCHDPDTNAYYKLTTLRSCKGPTMAFELNHPENLNMPGAITFCTWFLDYAMRQDHRFLNDVRLKRFKDFSARMDTGEWLKLFGKRAQIDFLNLFDGTVVHELTHTGHGGETVDVKYGWQNCREISLRESDRELPVKDNGPIYNADSYSLFASASWYINQGGTVHEDGTLEGGDAVKAKL